MKALILGAGFGTRLLPHTRRIPKPLFPIAGRPIIDTAIERLVSAGVDFIVINTHHLHEQIEAHVSKTRYPVPVYISHEPEILGTGGAIRANARQLGPGPFMVLNADIDTNIDIRAVFEAHMAGGAHATLVLCDHPGFNTVRVDADGFVTGFGCKPGPGQMLTFTGIQVIDGHAAAFMPETIPGSSITGYERMIRKGEKIKAYILNDSFWNDVGSPERFIQSAARHGACNAFQSAFGKAVRPDAIWFSRLSGDGSDRKWYRVFTAERTMIMAGHGIKSDPVVCEADAFVNIGRHLYRQGIPVPGIYFYDRFAGLVFMEDLGDIHLFDLVSEMEGNDTELIAIYKKIIEFACIMWITGYNGFDRSWAYQTQTYDQSVIIERECKYFFSAFINGHLEMSIDTTLLEDEFRHLAARILENRIIGFMHRDLQSANIMIKDNRPFFIDFQAGRAGPIQYDMASLLADPYVCIPGSLLAKAEDELMEHAMERLSKKSGFSRTRFIKGYQYCRISRLLQALGAFGFLFRVKKKARFAKHMPAAMANLLESIHRVSDPNLSGLARVAEKAAIKMGL